MKEVGWSPWMLWFAWRPVALSSGGYAWLQYVRCRKFTHEPIWGASPDPHWQYELVAAIKEAESE